MWPAPQPTVRLLQQPARRLRHPRIHWSHAFRVKSKVWCEWENNPKLITHSGWLRTADDNSMLTKHRLSLLCYPCTVATLFASVWKRDALRHSFMLCTPAPKRARKVSCVLLIPKGLVIYFLPLIVQERIGWLYRLSISATSCEMPPAWNCRVSLKWVI